jgi:hypothetical protein
MRMSGEQDAAVSMAVMAVLAIILHGIFTKGREERKGKGKVTLFYFNRKSDGSIK